MIREAIVGALLNVLIALPGLRGRALRCCGRDLIDDLRPRRRASARRPAHRPGHLAGPDHGRPRSRLEHDRCTSHGETGAWWSLRSWRCGRDPRRHRAGAVRDHLLPPLVPAGAVRRQVPGRGERQPRARGEGRGAARADRRPQRHAAGRQPHRARGPGAARAAARATRRGARREIGRLATRARRCSPAALRRKIRHERTAAAVQPGDAQDRRLARHRALPAGEPDRASPASTSSGSSCASTRTRRSARTCSARSAR